MVSLEGSVIHNSRFQLHRCSIGWHSSVSPLLIFKRRAKREEGERERERERERKREKGRERVRVIEIESGGCIWWQ